MKIIIDDTELFSRTFDDSEDLIKEVQDTERAKGNEVPLYAWESLAIIIGAYLLEKAADEVYDWITRYNARKKAEKEQQATAALQAARHYELVKKLDELILKDEMTPPVLDLNLIEKIAKSNKFRVLVILETDVEADLNKSLRAKLGENVEIQIQPNL